MARSKQATPVRREVSSEYISKQTIAQAKREASELANGRAKAEMMPVDKKDAGVTQLVIAVAGIYASLYVDLPFASCYILGG
jgi:solute carrier family 35 (UDP-galactose transporter), member B1